MIGLLNPVLEHLMINFQATKQYICLEPLAAIIEIIGKLGLPGSQEHFSSIVHHVTEIALGAVNTTSPEPEFIIAYFDLLYHFLLHYSPNILFASTFRTVFQLLIACLEVRQKDVAKATFQLLLRVLSLTEDTVTQLVRELSSPLVLALLLALTDVTPRELLFRLTDVIYALICSQALPVESLHNKFVEAFQDSKLLTLQLPITENDKTTFLRLIFRLVPQKGKFKAMVVDFALICRFCMTSDALLAYDLS